MLSCVQAHSMGVSTNITFLTNLVNAAAKCKRWVMAAQLLQLMRTYGMEPNEITYTAILSAMSKAKQVRIDSVVKINNPDLFSILHSGATLCNCSFSTSCTPVASDISHERWLQCSLRFQAFISQI